MVRPDRIVMAAGGLLARAALGVLGLALLIGWNTPTPRPVAAAGAGPDDPERATTIVMLRVPEGEVARHLTVVDASGRELATVSRWVSGMTTMIAGRTGGPVVSYSLNTDGSLRLRVDGTERSTVLDAEPDGRSRVTHQDSPLAWAARPGQVGEAPVTIP